MGQSHSRNRDSQQPSQPQQPDSQGLQQPQDASLTTAPHNTHNGAQVPQPQPPAPTTPTTSAPSPAVELGLDAEANLGNDRPSPRTLNRPSVRRSLMNLVKPAVTMRRGRNRVDSTASGAGATTNGGAGAPGEKKLKSWRSSRRWSKARLEDEVEQPVAGSSTSTGEAVGVTAASPAAATTTTSVPTPIPEETEKGKEKEGEPEQPATIGGSESDDVRNQRSQRHASTLGSQSPGPMPSTSSPDPRRVEHPVTTSSQAPAHMQTQPHAHTQAIPIPVVHQSACAPEPEPSLTTTTTMNRSEDSGSTPTRPRSVSTDPRTPATQGTSGVHHDQQQGSALGLGGLMQGEAHRDERRSQRLPQPTVPPPPPPPPSPPQQAPAHPATRQFPPPGTLVVVQGIVHTTDVSRSNTSSSANSNGNSGSEHDENSTGTTMNGTRAGAQSQPSHTLSSDSSGSRNRLSTLLGRTGGGSGPASRMDDQAAGSGEDVGVVEQDRGVAGGGEVGRGEETSTSATQDQSQRRQRDQQQPERSTSTISSSSIDVLGTLLSVAAAATAASLLTGSSEPILSSGLAPPTLDSTNSSPSPSSSPFASVPHSASSVPSTSSGLPTSPTSSTSNSTLSTPFISSSPSPRPTGISDMSPAGRAERMRQAWSTIRERLGLRANPPSTSSTFSSPTSTSTSTPTSSSSSSSTSSGTGATGGRERERERNQTLTDTREQMLAEMARAFNIGLGLGPNASTGAEERSEEDQRRSSEGERRAEGTGDGGSERSSGGDLPPEGSFERFLVELQTDLRVALTQEREEQGNDAGDATERNEEHERRDVEREAPTSTSVDRQQPASTPRSLVPTEPADSDDEDSDIPPLQDPSNSDSEDEGSDESVEDDFSSANTSPSPASSEEAPRTQPTPESRTQPANDRSSATGLDASGRINWWRLYRFPPVTSARSPIPEGITAPGAASASAPRPTTTAASSFTPSIPANTSTLSETSPAFSSNSPNSHTSTSSSTPTSSSPTTHEPAQNASANASNNNGNGNSVIPVIIVGLQSVNTPNWRPMMPMDEMEGADLFDEDHHHHHHHHHPHHHHPHHRHHHHQPMRNRTMMEMDEDDEDDDAFFGGFGPSMQARQERRRGWPNRAASALRNLRPAGGTDGNRRSQSFGVEGGSQEARRQHQQLPAMMGGPGSRTFLIYVIGGYYPPDHSIVTGGPDNLESFEALLELVELLGNAKAATATKEDIEKSGLEVIKKTKLEEYERQNKVASNCIERCLICLDDYEEQDEIRVMGCRHAFHRGCVDKWLQTGKNNCPACRSRGVSTEGPSSPQTVS